MLEKRFSLMPVFFVPPRLPQHLSRCFGAVEETACGWSENQPVAGSEWSENQTVAGLENEGRR